MAPKRPSSHQYLFALLGSACIKAACKNVSEIDRFGCCECCFLSLRQSGCWLLSADKINALDEKDMRKTK